MKKINIGIIRLNTGEFGGIEHQIIYIASGLDKSKYQCYLITDDVNCRMANEFKAYGSVLLLQSRKYLAAVKAVRHYCKEYSIDIIQSHMLKESFYGRGVKLFNPKLIHLFRVHTYINCSFIPAYKKKLYHLLSFLTGCLVDRYLPINEANYQELVSCSRVSKKKTKVIHNGVRSLEQKAAARPFDYYHIAMLANFVYGKGQDIAVKAMNELLQIDQRYHLTFIGGENSANQGQKTPLTDEIKKMIEELNITEHFNFYGYADDMSEAIAPFDIIILPSYSEGTPNVLLEAMSVKKLVIASAVGGVPEFIIPGKTGFMHENKKYHELSDLIYGLKKLDSAMLNDIKENGCRIWKEEYSIQALCDNLSNLYIELLK